MKQSLEKLLTLGRTLVDSKPLVVGNNELCLEVDYKVILMSNYVSRRVKELSGRSLEISFVYGGLVQRQPRKTTLKLDSFYVPDKQRIASSYFQGTSDSTYGASKFFATQHKRIVAIGHSHADYDVFHSSTDLDNYKSLCGMIGVKVEHNSNASVSELRRYVSKSTRLGMQFSINKISHTPSTFSYALPSLIFNTKGKVLDCAVAVKSYAQIDGRVQTKFNLHDCDLHVYNKQAVLTDDDKKMLDFSIRKVLSYNSISVQSEASRVARFG